MHLSTRINQWFNCGFMIIKYFSILIDLLYRAFLKYIKSPYYKSRLGYCGRNVVFKEPSYVTFFSLIEMHDNTNLYGGLLFLSMKGKFVMKKGAAAAQRLTVITGNHGRQAGLPFKDDKGDIQKILNQESDVVVEEDVWIGSDVVLCSGVTIGRCSNIGAGSVVRYSIPPYAIVLGNPAKVVGFCMTPSEIIEHEKVVYPESMRLPLSILEKNYDKYFLRRLKEIKEFSRL